MPVPDPTQWPHPAQGIYSSAGRLPGTDLGGPRWPAMPSAEGAGEACCCSSGVSISSWCLGMVQEGTRDVLATYALSKIVGWVGFGFLVVVFFYFLFLLNCLLRWRAEHWGPAQRHSCRGPCSRSGFHPCSALGAAGGSRGRLPAAGAGRAAAAQPTPSLPL